MIQVTKQQANERYETLPDSLKDALFSDVNVDEIYRICLSNHLPKEKIPMITRLAGLVILGFIHPEDLAKEITEDLMINSKISEVISSEINKRIFVPLQNEIKNVYKPAPAASWGSNVIDLKATKPEVPVPQKPSLPIPVPVAPPKIEITKSPAGNQVPVAPAQIKPVVPNPLMPFKPSQTEEAPFIIHEEVKLKPESQGAASKSLGGLFNFSFSKKKDESGNANPVTAQIKFGEDSFGKTEPVSETKGPPKTRIVHYTELRTPLAQFAVPASVQSPSVSTPPSSTPKPPVPIPPKPFQPIRPTQPPPETLKILSEAAKPNPLTPKDLKIETKTETNKDQGMVRIEIKHDSGLSSIPPKINTLSSGSAMQMPAPAAQFPMPAKPAVPQPPATKPFTPSIPTQQIPKPPMPPVMPKPIFKPPASEPQIIKTFEPNASSSQNSKPPTSFSPKPPAPPVVKPLTAPQPSMSQTSVSPKPIEESKNFVKPEIPSVIKDDSVVDLRTFQIKSKDN